MADDSTWRLIDRAARGSPSARAEFANAYEPSVRAFFERAMATDYARHDAIDDLTQEVFVECFKEAGALQCADPTRDFGGFFHGLMSNVLRRHREHRARQPQSTESSHRALVDESAVGVTLDRRYAKDLFRDALDRIQHEAVNISGRAFSVRDLLFERYRDGKPPREIAAAFTAARSECSAKQVSEAASQAKLAFGKALEAAVRHRHPSAGEQEIESMCLELAALISKGPSHSGSPPVW